jgi:acetyl-CoA carboxylase biotin carboxyl carrier protein
MALIDVTAPMVGSVFEIHCEVGKTVSPGDELIILESMKMEIPVESEHAGTVAEVLVEPSMPVEEGDVVLRIEVA